MDTEIRSNERQQKIQTLASQVMGLARDNMIMHLRFLDTATASLRPMAGQVSDGVACDGAFLYYDPAYVLRTYQKEPASIARIWLHALLHCIFYHSFRYDAVDREYWDVAADMAVENTILELDLPSMALPEDEQARKKLYWMKKDAGGLTAEKIYRYFMLNGMGPGEKKELHQLFYKDSHFLWEKAEELTVTMEQWKKISQRVKTDLKTFSKGKNNAESLEENLAEANREKYDYAELLRRFSVMGESIQVNPDEFDYIYYTYGLSTYGNMPLVEPLEYKEAHKVKEFIIALDTSASCRGPVVKGFLKKTYGILKGTENFFQKINVHIIQCDSEIQSDTKITCDADFDRFLREGKLKGFGSTDFRPVFSYIQSLREAGEFENLKGLIYFTDGYGIYPEVMPDYDVIFAFLNDDDNRMAPPPWAVQVVLYEDMEDEA